MKRRVRIPGGDLEYAVLTALWHSDEELSAPAIHAAVGEPRGLAYTTTGTILDRLTTKRLVRRVRRGKAFFYTAAHPRQVIERARVTDGLRRLFGSGPRPLMVNLVDALEAMDSSLLDELAHVVASRRKGRHGA
jgi:predicted transcriptional regulator